MARYKIWKIERDPLNIKVVIENEIGIREGFIFPLADGWGEVDSNGELKCVNEILKILKEREEKQHRLNAKALDLEQIKTKHEGREFEIYSETTQDGKIIFKHKEVKNNV